MLCSCVRQTDLPHSSRLFTDSLYHPDRTAPFYYSRHHDFESVVASARQLAFPAARRAALVAALAEQNPPGASLEKLARPDAVAVVTGQQVGLFSGPAYTIYKALTAVKVAELVTRQGIPAVPVFWLATEDHDFAEVNHAWVFDGGYHPVKLEMRRSAGAQPVGEIALVAPPLGELREQLRTLPHGEEVAGLVEESYRPGGSMGGAFGTLLRRILAEFDILQLNPLVPAFRELAAPLLSAAVEATPSLVEAVLERNRELAAAGYHAQVHVEKSTSLVFLLEEGKRLALRRHENGYVLNGRRLSTQELIGRAASLSPNALLRPVVQDSILPTAAYIGGPSELAYLAQSEVIYRLLLGRMPVVLPRGGFTLLDERSHKLLKQYELALPDFFHGEEMLRERLAARLVPPALNTALRNAASAVDQALARLHGEVAGFDPTLGAAIERSGRKIRYQLGKIERKTARETIRRDARASRDAASLSSLVYPERHLQERLYSILPFLAKHGVDLPHRLYEAVDPHCPDHRLVVV